MFFSPSPLASYHIAPLIKEGVSLMVVGRAVGFGVVTKKGLVKSGLLLLLDEELLLLLLLLELEELPLEELELPMLLSKLGLHGNPSSNFFHANSHLSPSPGGL